MAKASDNPFPSLLIAEGTEPAAPAAGRQRLYIDSTTHLLKRTDSSGVDVTIEGAAAATDGWVSTSGFSYSSADSPTFVITTAADLTAVIPVGARIKLTQTTAKYFIVTAITASTITVYGGTDYTLANAAITSPFYSLAKAPVGFPLNPDKWAVEVINTSAVSTASPVANTWYNNGSITISVPIGCWRVFWQASGDAGRASSSGLNIFITLSTANNSESDTAFTGMAQITGTRLILPQAREKTLVLTVKTSYFLNVKTNTSGEDFIDIRGDQARTVIRATSAYL